MTTTNQPTIDNTPRLEYIKYLWTHEFTALWIMPGVIFGLFVGFLLGWQAEGGITDTGIRNFIETFKPEMLSIAITVLALYYIDQRRSDKREEKRLKEELLWQVRSRVTDVAVSAIDRIQANGWFELLKDQILHNVKWIDANLYNYDLSRTKMWRANLSGADMAKVNLSSADLWSANLSGADMLAASLSNANIAGANLSNALMWEADLSNAIITGANLSKADLLGVNLSGASALRANLSGANMWQANLSGTNMWQANLSGANMRQADLSGAKLEGAKLDEHTILPDSTYWTSDTDMRRFTDPTHPQFWRSDDSTSPAYRGDATEA